MMERNTSVSVTRWWLEFEGDRQFELKYIENTQWVVGGESRWFLYGGDPRWKVTVSGVSLEHFLQSRITANLHYM